MPLSAVAARKAALAAKQILETTSDIDRSHTDTTNQSPQPLPSALIEQTTHTASTAEVDLITPKKRKSKEGITPQKLQAKKRKKLVNADIGRTRYFEAQQPIEGFDDDHTLDTDISVDARGCSRMYPSSQRAPVGNNSDEDVLASGFVTEDPAPSRAYSPSQPIMDSSEEEGENQVKQSGQLSTAADTQDPFVDESSFETFVPQLDFNVFRLTSEEFEALRLTGDGDSQTAHLFLIPPRRSLTFIGTARVTLLYGSMSLLGTTLKPSRLSHRIFSPRSSPLAVLAALDPSTTNISEEFEQISLSQRALHTGVERLGRVCRIFERAFDSGQDCPREKTDSNINIRGLHILDPNTQSKYHLQPFYMPKSWKTALDDALAPLLQTEIGPTKSFIALIRGPKKCGKSTFARTILNHLTTQYRRVAFLECDLGQSEFTPSGMVSLHIISSPVFGPPFTHPTMPYRAHYVGGTTPRSTPAHYLSCIEALTRTYRMDVQYTYQEKTLNEEYDIDDGDNRLDGFIPLVVNTQGWFKGLGGELLRKIEEIIEPTNIFDLETQPNIIPQKQQQPLSSARLHHVKPIPAWPLATFYTPADYRTLSILSYFHAVFTSQNGEAVAWSVDLPLCAKAPWEVDCKEAIDSIVLTGAGYEDVVPSELPHAINCGIVGLVCEEDPMADLPTVDPQNPHQLWPYTQGGSVPSPETSHCIGLALIRGVDAENGSLHVLTPVPPSLLEKCRIFVKGELEMPVWGMIDFRQGQDGGVAGVKWDKVPYLQVRAAGGTTAIGGSRRRVRKNLMRRGQLQ
ncbi:hypothetical protein BU17DRAFT_101226 [Hysterangium stoloniferum]|nr:hypothetical protein BU17DRAFT_101226 [Hysterangium stoloniferum]